MSSLTLWLTIVGAGAVTFALHLSFIALLPANEPYPSGCPANLSGLAKEVRDEELLKCDAVLMNLTERKHRWLF